MHRFKQLFTLCVWPLLWLLLGLTVVIGLDTYAKHQATKNLRVEGEKTVALSQKWAQKITEPIYQMVQDARLRTGLAAENTPNISNLEQTDINLKRLVNEFSYLYGVPHIYLFSTSNLNDPITAFSSLPLPTEVQEKWLEVMNQASPSPRIHLVSQPKQKGALLTVIQPISGQNGSEIIGGKGGGGRKDFAQAGGQDDSKIIEAFESIKNLI